jgi:hypothetical protein
MKTKIFLPIVLLAIIAILGVLFYKVSQRIRFAKGDDQFIAAFDESLSNRTNARKHVEQTSIPANEAKHHIGEDSVVSGKLSEIFVSKQNNNVYLYLDGSTKNAQFVAVWLGNNEPPTKTLQNLIFSSEPIYISGKIITENNVPEIIVSSWAQIN